METDGDYDYDETVATLSRIFGIVGICPVSGDYEPGEPECGFLFPAYMDGGAAMNYVDVYQKNQEYPHTELLKLLGVYEIEKISYKGV